MDRWAYDNKLTLDFSRPSEPTDNPYIESFNGKLRDECLNVHWFHSLADGQSNLKRLCNKKLKKLLYLVK